LQLKACRAGFAARRWAADEFGLDQFQLPVEEAAAVGCFLRQRIAIAGRAAFEHVADVHVRALHAAGLDDFVEQLAGPAHERFAQTVFVGPRRLAEKAEPGVWIPHAKDGVWRASQFAQRMQQAVSCCRTSSVGAVETLFGDASSSSNSVLACAVQPEVFWGMGVLSFTSGADAIAAAAGGKLHGGRGFGKACTPAPARLSNLAASTRRRRSRFSLLMSLALLIGQFRPPVQVAQGSGTQISG
jgi:hypothetical protein